MNMMEAGKCTQDAGDTLLSLLDTVDANVDSGARNDPTSTSLAHDLVECQAELARTQQRILQCEEQNSKLQTEALRLALQPAAPRNSSERVPRADIARATRAAQRVLELQRRVVMLEDEAGRSALRMADMEQAARGRDAEIRVRDDRIAALLEERHGLVLQMEALQADIVERDEQLRQTDREALAYHESELLQKEQRIWDLQARLAANEVSALLSRHGMVTMIDAATDAGVLQSEAMPQPWPLVSCQDACGEQVITDRVAIAERATAAAEALAKEAAAAAVAERAAGIAASERARKAEEGLNLVSAEALSLRILSAHVATGLALVEAKVQILESLLIDLLRATNSALRASKTMKATPIVPIQSADNLQPITAIQGELPPILSAMNMAPWVQYQRPQGSRRTTVGNPCKIHEFQVIEEPDNRDLEQKLATESQGRATIDDDVHLSTFANLKGSNRVQNATHGSTSVPGASNASEKLDCQPGTYVQSSTIFGHARTSRVETQNIERRDESAEEALHDPDFQSSNVTAPSVPTTETGPPRAGLAAAALQDGSQYIGEWGAGGEPEGRGILQRPDGGVYTGLLRHGRPHGAGILLTREGGMYQGEWADGLRHGYGVEAVSGTRFAGPWISGERHGLGVVSGSGGIHRSIVEYQHDRAVRTGGFPKQGEAGFVESVVLLRVAKAAARAAADEAARAQALCSILTASAS